MKSAEPTKVLNPNINTFDANERGQAYHNYNIWKDSDFWRLQEDNISTMKIREKGRGLHRMLGWKAQLSGKARFSDKTIQVIIEMFFFTARFQEHHHLPAEI